MKWTVLIVKRMMEKKNTNQWRYPVALKSCYSANCNRPFQISVRSAHLSVSSLPTSPRYCSFAAVAQHRYHIIWSKDCLIFDVFDVAGIAGCLLDFDANHWQTIHTVVVTDSNLWSIVSSPLSPSPPPTKNCIPTTMMILHPTFYLLNYLSLTVILVALLFLHGFPMAQSHHWDHCWQQRQIIFYLDFVVPFEADKRVAFLFFFCQPIGKHMN